MDEIPRSMVLNLDVPPVDLSNRGVLLAPSQTSRRFQGMLKRSRKSQEKHEQKQIWKNLSPKTCMHNNIEAQRNLLDWARRRNIAASAAHFVIQAGMTLAGAKYLLVSR